ncbi:MAG: hypothetical protein ACR2QM_21090 [Longimicrobiales bacterium]
MADRPARRLGEFGLIVVGVFLALLAENAWAARGNTQSTQSYLADLHGDLSRDTLFLRIVDGMVDEQAAAARALLAELEVSTSSMTPSETAVALFAVTYVLQFFVEFPTYADLNASGNMRLLPPAIRLDLVAFHMALTSRKAELPAYPNPSAGLGLLPGDLWEALNACHVDCGNALWDPSPSDLNARAELTMASLGEEQQRRMMEWRSVPNIGRIIEGTLVQNRWFLDRLRELRGVHERALGTVEAALLQ